MAITKHTNTAFAETNSKNFLANGWHLSITTQRWLSSSYNFIRWWIIFYQVATNFLSRRSKIFVSTQENFYRDAANAPSR